MNAREVILMNLTVIANVNEAEANTLPDQYAHELAEDVRGERKSMEAEAIPEHAHLLEGMTYAADTIDPYSYGAGPVRPDEEPTT